MPNHLQTASTSPQDLHGLTDEELQTVAQEVREHIIDTVGEIGGHFGANLGTCEIAVALHSLLDSPRDKVLWDVGHQAYPHKVLTGRRDQLHTIRKYGGLAPFCSIGRVRARHHGRRPRLDRDRLRGRDQGGDAPRPRRGRPCRRGRRRRRDDRRGRVRGGASGRRRGHPDRRRAQRQRHVDRPERRRAVALLQPRPSQPQAVARPRGRRGRPDQAAGRDRRRVRAARPPLQGVDQGLLGARPVVGGARLRLHGRDRRPRRPRPAPRPARGAGRRAPGGGALRDRQGQGLRPRRGGRPRGHGEVARRQAEVDRQRRARRAGPPGGRAPRRRRRSTRRCSARRSCASAGATSA